MQKSRKLVGLLASVPFLLAVPSAEAQLGGQPFDTSSGFGRSGSGTGLQGGGFGGRPTQTPGGPGMGVGRPGPFGQNSPSGFFGPNGLDVLGMAGMSAFFSRDTSGLQGRSPLGAGQFGMAGTGIGPMGNFGFPRGQFGRGRDARDSSRPPVRAQLSIGFEPPPVAPPAVRQRLIRLLETSDLQRLGPIQVTMVAAEDPSARGVTAVLRGQVATPEDRQVAEQLALLDPGVSAVTNELEVAPPLPPPNRP